MALKSGAIRFGARVDAKRRVTAVCEREKTGHTDSLPVSHDRSCGTEIFENVLFAYIGTPACYMDGQTQNLLTQASKAVFLRPITISAKITQNDSKTPKTCFVFVITFDLTMIINMS